MIVEMEQLIPPKKSRFTAEEYLQMEAASASKHEYRHGQIIDMAGGTFNHASLSAKCLTALAARLAGKPWTAIGSDLRVRITGTHHYCYPDVTVVGGTPLFDPPDQALNLINPQVIIEVSSPSTEKDDRGDKFYDYMRIESLKEYFLISQDRLRVDTFYRQTDGIWAIGPSYNLPDTSVLFRSLHFSIPISEIYAGVDLSSPPPENSKPPEAPTAP
jgi:Uma2 family endonuclease